LTDHSFCSCLKVGCLAFIPFLNEFSHILLNRPLGNLVVESRGRLLEGFVAFSRIIPPARGHEKSKIDGKPPIKAPDPATVTAVFSIRQYFRRQSRIKIV
jgi:hypothetical protein